MASRNHGRQPQQFNVKPVTIQHINPMKIRYFQHCTLAEEELKQELANNHADFTIQQPNTFQAECSIAITYDQNAVIWAKSWHENVKGILQKHLAWVNFHRVNVNEPEWERMKEAVDSANLQSEDVRIFQLSTEKAYVAVGRVPAVDEVFEQLKYINRTNASRARSTPQGSRERQSIRLQPHQLLLLSVTSFAKDMANQYSVKIFMNNRTKEITFDGEPDDVRDAAAEMQRKLDAVKSSYYIMSEGQIKLLAMRETRSFVVDRFRADSIVAVWEDVSSKGQHLLQVSAQTDAEKEKAVGIISKQVAEHECSFPPDNENLIQSPECQSLLNTLRDGHRGKLFISIPGGQSKLVITATNDILDSVTKEMEDFLWKATRHEEILSLETPGLAAFFKTHCIDKIQSVKERLRHENVEIIPTEQGLSITGTKEAIQSAKRMLADEVASVVHTEKLLGDPLHIKFLNTTQCKAELQDLEKKKSCLITVEEGRHQIQATSGSIASGGNSLTSGSLKTIRRPSESSSSVAHADQTASSRTGLSSVLIVKGEIAKQEVDMLVNSAPSNLDLNTGAVSSSILREAGPGIQDEVTRNYPAGVKQGSVAYSGGHKLRCLMVCHMALKPWGPGSKKSLSEMVTGCLTFADGQGFTSLALPSLGTGNLNYPPEKVAEIILYAVLHFYQTNPSTKLRQIRIVVYHTDHEIFKEFQNVKLRLEGSPSTGTTDSVRFSQSALPLPASFRKAAHVLDAGEAHDTRQLSSLQQLSLALAGASRFTDTPRRTQNLTARLDIYTRSREAGSEVLNAFNDLLKTNIKKKEVEEKQVGLMTGEEKKTIRRICQEHDVHLHQEHERFFIEGLESDVTKALLNIKELFHSSDRKEKEDALARVVQWSYLKNNGRELKQYTPSENCSLEKAYQAQNPSVEIAIQSKHGIRETMVIDLRLMKQYPKHRPSKVYDVIRRDILKEATQLVLPGNWTGKDLKIPLDKNSAEYRQVERNLRGSLKNRHVAVLWIERIQNPRLWKQYMAQKEHMDKQNGFESELRMWHGTHSDAKDRIIKFGFNRSYCGRNATMYGDGVYFAVESSYSAQKTYSPPDSVTSFRYIFQCKVLRGHAVQGKQGMRTLPDRPGAGLPYDSATDNLQNPAMYVIFSDNQAYPEYIITFNASD